MTKRGNDMQKIYTVLARALRVLSIRTSPAIRSVDTLDDARRIGAKLTANGRRVCISETDRGFTVVELPQ